MKIISFLLLFLLLISSLVMARNNYLIIDTPVISEGGGGGLPYINTFIELQSLIADAILINKSYADSVYLDNTDTNTWWSIDNEYLINDTNILTFDETILNSTIDSKLSTYYYNVTSANIIAGTIDGGALSDTQHSDAKYDGVTFNVSEVSGSPGLDIRLNFTGDFTTFNRGVMRYKTSGLSGDYPIIQMWDYDSGSWEDYPVIGEIESFATITQPVFDGSSHTQGGVARMRIYKSSNGNTNNHYFVDWVSISDGVNIPSGQEVDPLSIHRDGSIELTSNWDVGSFGLNATFFEADSLCVGSLCINNWSEVNNNEGSQWNITGSKYLNNCSGILCINESVLNNTIDARDTNTQLSNSTVETIISNQDVYLKNTGDTATGEFTFNNNFFSNSTVFSGDTAPTTLFTNMLWQDTSVATRFMLKRYNGSDWIKVYSAETATRTVNVDNSMSTAEIQAEIDSIGRNILAGVVITLQFADGTYTLIHQLEITGFYGGGRLQIYGNAGDNSLSTTKAVYLDWVGQACYGFYIHDNMLANTYVFYLKMRVNTGTSHMMAVRGFGRGGLIYINYCYIIGTGTSYGYGAYFSMCKGYVAYTYVNNLRYGLSAGSLTMLRAYYVDDIGTMPVYGIRSDAGIIFTGGTQITGSTANQQTTNGGQIW